MGWDISVLGSVDPHYLRELTSVWFLEYLYYKQYIGKVEGNL